MSIHRYQKKSGYGWKAYVQITPTKQLTKRFSKKSDAEAWERMQRSKLDSGELKLKETKSLRLAKLIEHWQNEYAPKHLAPSSIWRHEQCIRNQILPFLGNKKIDELNYKLINHWLHLLRNQLGLSAKTCNMVLGLLKSILSNGVRREDLKINPIAKVKGFRIEPKDYAFWNTKEVDTFLDHCRRFNPKFYQISCFALLTGMRRGEIQALKWDCIDLEAKLITVKRNYCDKSKQVRETTKGRKIRRVPINQQLFELLMDQQERVCTNFVFKGVNFRDASLQLKKIAIIAGVTPIRFHDLRHTFASNFMKLT